MNSRVSVWGPVIAVAALPLGLWGCNSGSGEPPMLDSGVHEGGGARGCSTPRPVKAADGFSLTSNPCVDQTALGPGQLLLTASGEVLALEGYTFPSDPNGVFADGWQISFTHFLATFDKVSLWTDPDEVPTDQSKVGSLVAEADGPWAVDMHANGPVFPYVEGKEPGERAVAFAVMTDQNKAGGGSFDTSGSTAYAFGFSAVTATPHALNVNLDAEAMAAYETMVLDHCTVLYVGTATWRGDVSPGKCASPSGDGGADGGNEASTGIGTEPEFARIPRTVDFDLCFRPKETLAPGTLETSYVNCDNQDNDPMPGVNDEPHARGVYFKPNAYVIGEVTFHTDHPFWESTKHDSPARFDPFAAQAVGLGGTPTVHFTDTLGLNYLAFTDREGHPLPWRTCDPNYANPNGGGRVGQMHFDPVHVPHCTNDDPATGLCDYYDFSKYDQSTQGHFNGADGLCFVERHYPSPP